MVVTRAILISLFADCADTAYSRLLKQPIPIVRPIIYEILLVKLFHSEHRPAIESFQVYCIAVGKLDKFATALMTFGDASIPSVQSMK